MAIPPPLLPLHDLADADEQRVGAKALNLARLARLGLPVPPGFCVPSGAYRDHLDGVLGDRLDEALGQLADADADAEAGALPQRLAELRRELEDGELAADLAAALERAWDELRGCPDGEPALAAVRSSATTEDLPGQSFAGQHDTLLGVRGFPGLVAALRRCWASLWTDRAYGYRARNGIDHGAAKMAVVVQQLVPAQVSGVIFTVDPVSGDADRLVIESCFGLGEALVSGQVAPDRIVFERGEGILAERDTALQELELVPDGKGGVVERAIDEERATEETLSDHQAAWLARCAIDAEEAFGAPQDLEFAISGGEPYLLQARPITTLAPPPPSADAADRVVWSNVNTGEVLPDVITPMTWSVVKPLVDVLIGGLLTRMGANLTGHTLFDLVGGRAYANLNTVLGVIRRIPGMRKRSLTELFGGSHDTAAALDRIEFRDQDIPDMDYSVWRMLRGMPGFVWQLLTYSPADGEQVLQRMSRRADELQQADLDGRSEAQLAELAQGAVDAMLGAGEAYEMTGIVTLWEQSFYANCTEWFGDEGNPLAARLLAGLGNNDNANAGLALWQLAVLAEGDEGLAAAVNGSTDFAALRERIEGTEAGGEFLAAWQEFMGRHGHHARGELELGNPRWSDCPDDQLDQVRSYLAAMDRHDFEGRFEALAAQRAQAEAEARGKLRNPFKRWFFGFLLRKTRSCSPIRESIKSQMVHQLAGVRRVVLALGERLAARGALEDPDGVFFLRLDELGPFLAGEPELMDKITVRREEYAANLDITVPAVVIGRFDPSVHGAETVDPNARELRGVAVSPGVVTGPARVILRAGTDQLYPGEILVAPFTDPGWTPYFLNAAAIVMDLGGILSHGSIVAREFGIPAVVNVGPATKIIQTGQQLRVDGAKGTVTLVDADE